MNRLTIRDLDLKGKKALIRVDFNVPCDKDGKITDETRIVRALPTIRYALDHGAAVLLMSHRGRPKGKKEGPLSLKPCAECLGKHLNMPVQLAPDCIGKETKALADNLKPGQVLLLENLRFHLAEEKPETDPGFAKELAALGDLYINDAFGTAHRAHSSIVPITRYFPDKSAAGFLLEKEIEFLGGIFDHPEHPFIALIGGAKVSSKIKALEALIPHIDTLLVGGGMAYTFQKAQGHQVGRSICEEGYLDTALDTIQRCKEKGVKLLLPVDTGVAKSMDDQKVEYIDVEEGIPAEKMGVDIGPKTIELFKKELEKGATIFWNGPVGVFEKPPFAVGTNALAKSLAKSQATTIVGGGESVCAISNLGLEEHFTHISTGGGASIELIEQGTLPGIEALSLTPAKKH